jgi:hypothetical protein
MMDTNDDGLLTREEIRVGLLKLGVTDTHSMNPCFLFTRV